MKYRNILLNLFSLLLVANTYSQLSPIQTPVDPFTLTKNKIVSVQEYVRTKGMLKDSLIGIYTLDKAGYCTVQKFRVDHQNNNWAVRYFSRTEDSLETTYKTFLIQNGKEVPFEEINRTYKTDGSLYIQTIKELDRNVVRIDTFPKKQDETVTPSRINLSNDQLENPLPHAPHLPRIDKHYTYNPYASNPKFTLNPGKSDYLWLDHYTDDGTNKIMLTEVFDHKGLLVMSWTRGDDRKIFYKYETGFKPKLHVKGMKFADPY